MLPQPEPAAGLDAYYAERALRLGKFPETDANYQRYLCGASERRAQSDRVDYLTVKLDIENISRCNFKCEMCPVSDWPHGKRAEDLSLDAFKKIIDEQTGLLEIKLQGLGEPTMQGGDFFAMIRYARAKRIWVRTTTNGSLLHLAKSHAENLVDSDVNEVQCSLDAANETVWNAVGRKAWFQVCRNFGMLNDAFAEAGKTRTKAWCVVQKANQDQLGAVVDTAADLGFKHLVFSLDVSGDVHGLQVPPITEEFGQELVDLGLHYGIRVAFWNATQRYDRERLCPWPFERAYISSDQRFVPCCVIGNPDTFEIGKAGDSVTETWHGEEMAVFRRAHLTGDIPAVCRGCYKGE